jgi:hypothetical protein
LHFMAKRNSSRKHERTKARNGENKSFRVF